MEINEEWEQRLKENGVENMEMGESLKERIYYLKQLLLQTDIRNSYKDLNELLEARSPLLAWA